MTTYVRFVDANTVQQAPPTWTWPDGSTTSNFPQSDPTVLASAGFLPYVDGTPPTPDATTVVGPPTYTTDGTTVTSTYPLVAKPVEQVSRETITTYLASALPTIRTLDTQAKTLSTLTLSGTTAQQLAQAQAALRQIGSGLDTVLAGLVKVARLLSDQLDGTT